MTTASITVFHPHQVSTSIRLQAVANVIELGTLAGGVIRSATDLAYAKKWYPRFFSPATVHVLNAPRNGTRVGSLFRVSRGQVTGANHIWIAGEKAVNLPARFLLPCVTGANELFAASEDGGQLKHLGNLKRVVNLPRDLDTLNRWERSAVDTFLTWAEQEGGSRGYIATHRTPWWAIRLLPAAPIVCTYMARRPPVFIRNVAGAYLLNIAHGLYPRVPMSDIDLDNACSALNKASSLNDGRVYAGGLTKFEPSAVEDMLIDWTSFTWLEAAV
jgi:hypothetical protein